MVPFSATPAYVTNICEFTLPNLKDIEKGFHK